MDYCWLGRIWVFAGSVAFAIGGLIATYGWNEWSLRSDKSRYFCDGAWDIIRGTIIVVLGGLLATHGWNVISFGEQRRNLIRAVFQETMISSMELDKLVEASLEYSPDSVGDKIKILPVVKTNALNAILASGLWRWDSDKDEEFLVACLNCAGQAEKANHVLSSITANLVTATTQEQLNAARVVFERLKSSDYQEQLKHLFDEVILCITENHEWALDELRLGMEAAK